MPDLLNLPAQLTHLVAQGALLTQSNPSDPQIAVLVLASDRQTILDCELRPLSELAAALAVQQPNPTFSGGLTA